MVFAVALVVHVVALYYPLPPSGPAQPSALDKVVHLLLFAAVMWAGRRCGMPVTVLAGVLLVHAPVSEVLQAALLPTRDGNAGDAVADVAGVVLGALIPVSAREGGPTRETTQQAQGVQ